MNLTKILILTVVGLALFLGIFWFVADITYNNKAIELYKACDAQNSNIENVHNEMWSILRDQAKVPASYAKSFDKIYTNMISGRYSKGDGTLMKWIQEANPNFSDKLYDKLMDNIEIQRTNFANQQKRMIDIKREYETYITKKPAKWFISKENSKPFEYVVISSQDTKDVIKTRVDNNEISLE